MSKGTAGPDSRAGMGSVSNLHALTPAVTADATIAAATMARVILRFTVGIRIQYCLLGHLEWKATKVS